jgi:hypothetical protein
VGSNTVSTLSNTLVNGAHRVLPTGGQTITGLDIGIKPKSLVVSSFEPTDTGFVAKFNNELNATALNLYDTQTAGLGPADLLLHGAASGAVGGSVVVDPSLREIAFIKTGGPLVADTYTARFRSAEDGFKDLSGQLLDGDGSGTVGDDFFETFTIAEAAANAVTVGVADFVRGPGQDVNVPADSTLGIPLTLSGGSRVRNITMRLAYEPTRLQVTGATLGPTMPPVARIVLDIATPGLATVTLFSPSDLPSAANTFVNLQAIVPAGDPAAIHGTQQILDVQSVVVRNASADFLPVIEDDGIHFVSYFGDVSGNRRINAGDAARLARFAALLDTGISVSLMTDPTLLGDISGNGRVNAGDASLVARFAALIDVPEIPEIPSGVLAVGAALAVAGLGLPGAVQGRMRDVTAGPAADRPPIGPPDLVAGPGAAGRIPTSIVDHAILELNRSAGALPNDEELSLGLEQAIEGLLSSGLLPE